jgi:hypothetical protein
MNGKQVNWVLYALEGIGIAFAGLFLVSYLSGLFMVPQTTVLHSIPEVKLSLALLGGVFLVLVFFGIIFKAKGSGNLIPPKPTGFVTPLKVGLLIGGISYFLFTLHATFVLSWVGEWEYLGANNPQVASWIFITDITAGIFLLFRFIASIVAVSAVILYFIKKGLPKSTSHKLLRTILVFEGLYWLGLLTSGIWGLSQVGSPFGISLLLSTGIPCIVASIGIPISLFMLAIKLNPSKPPKQAIKWALIAGVFYVLAFWLNNTGMWIITILDKGAVILTNSPELIASFVSTIAGLLALTVFMVYFAKKSIGTPEWAQLKIGTIGAIITVLGLFFLWNYLAWIFFDGWNQWYGWILGHNLDLYLLVLPLLGVPLLFYKNRFGSEKDLQSSNS